MTIIDSRGDRVPGSHRLTNRRSVRATVAALLLLPSLLQAQATPPAMPDSVRDYVKEAMAQFRSHSVHRDEVDWPALEDSVFARAAGAQTPSATWRALTWALRRVDPHSFVRPPDRMLAAMTGGMRPQTPVNRAAPRALGDLRDGRIGVVRVPPHTGANRPGYVDSLRAQLVVLDSANVCGWVVDLRENTGGNMWPMLAGIGPLLGAELVGSFTNSPAGSGWRYRDGRSWAGDATVPPEPPGWGSAPPRALAHAAAPVALVVGKQTASSGEMTLVAFLGRANVRSFGDTTAGFASSNASVTLRDSATMVVTAGYPLDRLGRRYPLRIAPDEVVPAQDSSGADGPLRHAAAWLARQPSCAARP